MLNLNALMNEIVKIRDAIDQVEVKGNNNRSLIVYAYNNCNELLRQLGVVLEEIQKNAEAEKQPDAEPVLREVTNNDTDENA
jgi:hypothetical protein